MSEPFVVDDGSFEEQVIRSAQPVLVDFWAPWCGPCQRMSPVLYDLASQYEGKLRFAKLNIDDNPLSPGRFGVRSIPTLILFRDGKETSRLVGFRSKGELKKQIDAALG